MWVAFVALILLVLGWAGHLWFWSRRLGRVLTYAETHQVVLPEAGSIELRRVGGPQGDDPPLLLIHGIASNHRNLDAHEEASFARRLALHRDVWLVSLRSGIDPRAKVDLQTMAKHDVATAVAEVLRRTQAPQLDCFAFSMGGMLMYIALAEGFVPQSSIRRLITLGTPSRFNYRGLLRVVTQLPPWFVRFVPLSLLSRSVASFAPVASRVSSAVSARYALTSEELALVLMNVICDIPPTLHADFRAMVRTGTLGTHEGYIERMRAVHVPLTVMASVADQIAPPADAFFIADYWGGETGRVLFDADAHGGPLGHGDLTLGVAALQRVIPAVELALAGSAQNETF